MEGSAFPDFTICLLQHQGHIMAPKVLRSKAPESDDEDEQQISLRDEDGERPQQPEHPSVSHIQRQLKQAQKRKFGLAFSSTGQSQSSKASESSNLDPNLAARPKSTTDIIYDRFTAQTGILAAEEEDKKMYVEQKAHSSHLEVISLHKAAL
jgi:hypothetical protein